MGRDDQSKHRQKNRNLRRKNGKRGPYKVVLIVCEGAKTEPRYLRERCAEQRLATANVYVLPSALGTEPKQVVESARQLFLDGDRLMGIEPRQFDEVFVVFDRDDHNSYHDALTRAQSLDLKLRNSANQAVPFSAIASVPCFELWLLLHFENIQAPMHRDDVYRQLRMHLPGYEKGQTGHWMQTRDRLAVASERAAERAASTNAHDGREPYTGLHDLVDRLLHLKD